MDAAHQTVTIRESTIASFRLHFPDLTRGDILHAIVRRGPSLLSVEQELLRLSAQKASLRFLPGSEVWN